ncbi:mediator of RNA polymerase II transcription subunit 15a [Vitis vinifera]|nr:mediator of RNA polymerase II transcription subunit 15a [Vitis vinifera]
MFAFLPHPRMQIQMDLTIMDMQIKMVHTLLQKLYTHLMLKQMESSVFLLMIMLSFASMETLKRHLPISGPEGLHELKKIVERFEEKIYSTTTSQSDYLRKISLKMLTMETKSFNATTNSLPSNSADHSKKSLNDKKSPARKKALRSRVWKQSVAASFLPSFGLEG